MQEILTLERGERRNFDFPGTSWLGFVISGDVTGADGCYEIVWPVDGDTQKAVLLCSPTSVTGRSPWEDLDLYLFDDLARSYEVRHNDAWLGARWQFQAGDIMDDIKPGLLLGVVLPVDVPEDMGDVWLRVEQDPSFAIYLGNASAIPLE